MNTSNDNGFNQSMNKKSAFLRFMRYVAVVLVTVWLFMLMIASADTDDFKFLGVIWITLMLFYITVPIIGFWIYSFVKAIKQRTKEDKRFLIVHLVDLLMIVVTAFFLTRPPQRCDAFIMADNCKGENGFWMRNIASRYRDMLPDSTRLCFEIDNEKSYPHVLSDKNVKELKKWLEYCGCIGIDVDNYTNKGYSTIRFRRIGFGMYSYRFYDKPLSRHEQDSINNNECLIVYNDSTVFEFGAGVFGVQFFAGKEDYLNRHKPKH